jgi:NADH-quinone oxidoreductase subunit N
VVAALPQARTLARTRPWLAAALAVCLFGLVGTPPTAVFAGKLTVFTVFTVFTAAAGDGGLGWLVVLAAVNTVASLFFYLRWLAPAVRGGGTEHTVAPWARTAAVTASLTLGVLAGPALALIHGPLLR